MRNISKIILAIILIFIFFSPNASGEIITIETNSMSHGPESTSDALDEGDMIEVAQVSSKKDIITYVEGRKKGYKTFGDYGDVIVFNRNDDDRFSPIVHRAIVWIQYNESGYNSQYPDLGSFDVPSMGRFNITTIFISNYGYRKTNLTLNLLEILTNFKMYAIIPHSGFLTKGDNNAQCDQISGLRNAENRPIRPIKIEWVKGKAQWPWFQNIFILLTIIVVIVIVVIIVVLYFRKRRKKRLQD